MTHRIIEQRVYRCDRCGAFYAREQHFADEGHPYDDSCSWIDWRDMHRGTIHDLCGACTADWFAFAAGQPLGDAK